MSNSADPESGTSASPILLKQYETAVAEYRFQVQLNWDRTKHAFAVNAALLAAAAGLLRLEQGSAVFDVAVAIVLVLGGLSAAIGAYAVMRGRQYYRRARDQSMELSKKLGIPADEALRTTPGMAESADGSATGTRPWYRSFARISVQMAVMLSLMAFASWFGAAYFSGRAIGWWSSLGSP